jgi:methyl-accepting chemotaxis protein
MKTTLRNLTLKQRLLFLPIFSLLGLIVLQLANSYAQSAIRRQVVYPSLESVMMSGYQSSLKSLVDSEAQTLGARLKTLKAREEQAAVIVAETDPIRFFDDSSGYFFSYDMDGIRVNVPINKSGNGKNMRGLLDSHGYPFVQAFIDQAKSGGGFVTYYFEKEGKGVQPKLSYAKLIPGSDIFIGAGIYIDSIEAQRIELAKKITSQ